MSKIQRSLLVGGTAVLGMFFSSSLLLAAPASIPLKTAGFAPPPAYQQYVKGQNKIVAVYGPVKPESAKMNGAESAKTIGAAPKEKSAKQTTAQTKSVTSAKASLAKAQPAKKSAPVQVASRSSGGAVSPNLIDYALSLQGIPYKFGGTTTAGFDCSGFTGYVFAKYGIKLPRTSFDQYTIGTKVNISNLQPGDLVFFTTYAKGASHVGISLGGGNFVHASVNGVKISSLTGYYAERFLGGRRVK